MKGKFFLVLICIVAVFISFSSISVTADDLSEEIEEQIKNLDLQELENVLSDVYDYNGNNVFEELFKLIKGEYSVDFNGIFRYILSVFISNLKDVLPTLSHLILLSFFCALIQNSKGFILNEELSGIILLVCCFSAILLTGKDLYGSFIKAKITIENLNKISEIMSPIILTLMVASGGTVSATMYKPALIFLNGTFINVIDAVIFPLIFVACFFSVICFFSKDVSVKNVNKTVGNIVKWLLGIIVLIYGIFISIQGIAAGTYDGISIKLAKYAVSSSVPIVGGLLKDGVDIVACGSALIKNAIGIVSIIGIFYTVLIPVINNLVLSFVMKISALFSDVVSDDGISELFCSVSTAISNLNAVILIVGLAFFITVLLFMFSVGVI